MNKELRNALKQYFGYSSFRNGQEEIIESIISGNNTLAVMPTGGGKSICYQLPAVLKPGICIVISPLIALMKDQVDTLNKLKIPTAFINSSISNEEVNDIYNGLAQGKFKMVYIAPERITSKRFISRIAELNISFIAVDEAHCISEWGHDFRPSYMLLPELAKELRYPPIIALTATATPEVQEDIIKQLEFKTVNRFIKGFDRPNLSYKTEICTDKAYRIQEIISASEKGSNMIYCGSRKKVESMAAELRKLGIKASYYHAGLNDNLRKQAQDFFINTDNSVIVATNAFGMGIDKANVRNVIHCDMTSTLESYYQEAGRAGRDGKDSVCTILFSHSDRDLQEFFIESNFPKKDDIATVYNYLYDTASAGLGTLPERSVYLDDYELAHTLRMPSYTVTSILKLFAKNNIAFRGGSKMNPSIKFNLTPKRLKKYIDNLDDKKGYILESLMRFVSSESFSEPVEFNLRDFLMKFSIKNDELIAAVQAFQFSDVISYMSSGTAGGLVFTKERMEIDKCGIEFQELVRRKINAVEKLDLVENYILTTKCKRNFILEYFGEDDINGTCGKCTSCNKSVKGTVENRTEFILKNLLHTLHSFNDSFSRSVIIDILRGNTSKAVLAFKLDKFDLFGICSQVPEGLIGDIFAKSVQSGFVAYGDDQYRKISITEKGLTYIAKVGTKKFVFEKKKQKAEYDEELFKKFLALRQGLALKEKVQERAIISDVMLKKLCINPPRSIKEMNLLGGLGQIFITNFADYFLNIINKHFASHVKRKELPEHLIKLYELCRIKTPIEDICKQLRMTKADFSKHFEDIIGFGYIPDSKIYSSKDLISAINKLPGITNYTTLREIKSKISIDCEYYELRIALAYSRSNS